MERIVDGISRHRFLAGYIVGIVVVTGSRVLYSTQAPDDAYIYDPIQAQKDNQQIEEQLAESFDIDGLILNGESFTFHTNSDDKLEVCRGNYKDIEGVASIAGPLTCSREVNTVDN